MNAERVDASELNALVDGELDAERQGEVEARLATDREAAGRVARYRAIDDGLHELFDNVLSEPLPAGVLVAVAGRRRPALAPALAIAAALALVVAGAIAGWFARDVVPGEAGAPVVAGGPPIDTGYLMAHAAATHAVFAPADEHAVEFTAAETDAMGEFLADRMGGRVPVPQLARYGYRLLGSRLLPDPNGPAAQFLFEKPDGRRLTLYLRTERAAGVDISYAVADDFSMYYWNDGKRSYALVGDAADAADRQHLLDAATQVHDQISK